MTDALARTPKQIRVEKAARRLTIAWGDGTVKSYDFDALRKDCPCADCKGHTPDQAKTIECSGVALTDIRRVGHYALNLVFDDGHDTGL
ncbi:MAG: gamma-butyrobetaine hydroxylase-like domain-containing protein, partial [Candidatus Methylomirabilis sp.]|nr:gamma-butyrobetaine hydroxylase-like domain-containing protein [Deltaproteobacteria bacterium]